jgi:hypothetical protein
MRKRMEKSAKTPRKDLLISPWTNLSTEPDTGVCPKTFGRPFRSPSAEAASSIVIPTKYRSLTSSCRLGVFGGQFVQSLVDGE